MLAETQDELDRRRTIEKARKEIEVILKRYKISIDDLLPALSTKKPTRKKAATTISAGKKPSGKKTKGNKLVAKNLRRKDRRAAVASKYHEPATSNKWSGRGRAPAWVTRICNAETINIEQFKTDPRFRI